MGGDEVFAARPRFVDDQNPKRPQMRPKDAIAEMLSEEKSRRKRTMLSWDKRSDYRTPDGKEVPLYDRQEGKFDGRLPYKGPIFGYYVQNQHIYLGKTREVTIEEVPEEKVEIGKVERKEPAVKETVHPRARVLFALKVEAEEIRRSNPQLCRVCYRYSAGSQTDYMAHFGKEHPEELKALIEQLGEAEPEAPAEPPRPKKRPLISPSA